MRNRSVQNIALGGLLAALSVVIFCLGGMIPVATYVCPTFCIMICQAVLRICGKRLAWAWYAAVAILALLFSPDKEGAALFVFLGCYPMLKIWLDRTVPAVLWKLLYFNITVALLYGSLIYLLGMNRLLEEYTELGIVGLVIMLILGNVVFFLLDFLLGRGLRRNAGKRG